MRVLCKFNMCTMQLHLSALDVLLFLFSFGACWERSINLQPVRKWVLSELNYGNRVVKAVEILENAT